MDYESFQRDLQAARLRGVQFQQRALEAVEGAALLPEALEELSTVLEELRVTDEQLRAQQEQLAEARQTVETERDQYLELFEAAPAAYLITDRVGVIQQANRRAAGLLGVAQQFLVGRPLAMFVVAEDRWALRDRLSRGGNLEWGSWQLRLQPRRHELVPTVVATSVIHDQGGGVAGLRWLLVELPSATPAANEMSANTTEALPALLAELVTSRPAGRPILSAVPSSAPDWDDLAAALSRVVQTAVPLLRADAVGLMLADHDGLLYGVTASDDAERDFERAQRDLAEGPCVDAYTSGQVVATADLWADPRWSRLGSAAKTNRIRGVLAAPVPADGRPVGSCNAVTTKPRDWTEADADAIRAYAAMLAQLIGSATTARDKAELAAQLQSALDSRVLIEQAKGVLMERHGLDDDAAFTRLRQQARASSRKVVEVARETIADRTR